MMHEKQENLENAIAKLNRILPTLELETALALECGGNPLALCISTESAELVGGQYAPDAARANLLAPILSSMLSAHAGSMQAVRVRTRTEGEFVFPPVNLE